MTQRIQALVDEGIYHRQLAADASRPMSLVLPHAYEPGYPYPLVVLLHGDGQNELAWIEAMPNLSRRNYVALALRGPRPTRIRRGQPGFTWGRERRCDAALEDYVFEAIEEAEQMAAINDRKIFLVGFCEGAALAYQLGLGFCESFAGVVALQGYLPEGPMPTAQLWRQSSPSVFVGHGSANIIVPPRRAEHAVELLTAAGLTVDYRLYPTAHRLENVMLRDVDHWLMNQCQRIDTTPDLYAHS